MACPDLETVQRLFSEALFDPSDQRITAHLMAPANADVIRRLDVYRNNVFYSLTTALTELYPVVQRLVGEDFFRATAAAFLRSEPVRQAAMVHFGAGFPCFLEHFEHSRDQHWLAEVARLELCRHRSMHAANSTALAGGDFADIPPDALPECRLTVHPSLHLVISAFPVLRIWEANQPEARQERIDLDAGGETFWILRDGSDIVMQREHISGIHFLQCLRDGATLAEATQNVLITNPDFIPTAIFSTAIANGFFTEIRRD